MKTEIINRRNCSSETLRKKRNSLFPLLLKGNNEGLLEKHSWIIDDYFRDCFEKSSIGPGMGIEKNPYAIIAQGGFGREEQCLHSDIDFLFVFKKRVPDGVKDLIRELVYPLWDLGFDVGYATRSLKECISLSKKNYNVLVPLLDARFICGISIVYSELMEQLQKKVINKKANKIIQWLIEEGRERYNRFSDLTFILEPNLKEGCGGLRDYHTMLWIGRIKFNLKRPRDLEYYGCLSRHEYEFMKKSLLFIWKVRNHLHHITGRKCDQLYFDYQNKLAQAMNFRKKGGRKEAERLLKELRTHMEFIKNRYQIFIHEYIRLKKDNRIAKTRFINNMFLI